MNRFKVLALGLVLFWTGSLWAQEPVIKPQSLQTVSKAVGKKYMAVSSDPIATKIGAEVLAKGGNAVDAAVTMGFVMAVTYPSAGNLGGGGFMLVSAPKYSAALDYRERAPLRAHKDMFLGADGEPDPELSRHNHLASGVPGTVAGLALALHRWGTLSLKDALAPAIALAEKGFVVDANLAETLGARKDQLARWPATKKIFFKGDQPYKEGELLVQADLAKTLKLIALKGTEGFYKGETAKLIAQQMAEQGGLIDLLDLKGYVPAIRKPVEGTYKGYEVLSMPPPSSGGVHLIQLLNILESFQVERLGPNRTQTIHLMTEAMKLVYADRSRYLGDADFVKVPVTKLISKGLARDEARRISRTTATPSAQIAPIRIGGYESTQTTHFSVIDAKGMAVSNTYTLNLSFGSGIVIAGTGVLMNNEMDDFSAKPGSTNAYGLIGGRANEIAPKKRMLSSMSPTIVRRNKKVVLVTGSPGGSHIITTTLQVILNVLDHQMVLERAVTQPRMHHQWLPDELWVEPGFDPEVLNDLTKKGHQIVQSRYLGAANSIHWNSKTGQLTGVADPRLGGLALGE
ncbi:MAG: gamma-glutamyltransferase [Candidatus Lambdaproteobacteria bacterium RIFOXYD12_FULL_49_8]|uniref:Glutathione hydrolase proenzyme n=1 Tax=Candidatus Lambdaproteobacteria bacterium RIFOXYD2_FULL_50_16 TaxID=1817772 RepID=A0A1F6G5Z5_9PROT|nr:MAG: gamma-glutamyltransferase [Candidatus Lambdaproteobacteria bacterium RIFOXYD2_FULL_50_16]OGG97644.1 MAG: gamma-glutamyltransferase [Candidatus Lambdaproteobacteria bacterium RIFOXYD12_FULL_49_8]